MLKIYNTITNKIEQFKPINPPEVNIYVCGPTVYDEIHIGNARPIIFFDMLKRYLKASGYKVKYVSNITDVDDKIISKAIELGKTEQEVTDYYIEKLMDLYPKLNCNLPDLMPKATDYIKPMTDYIKNLVDKGYAYELDGDVYFRVKKLKEYGVLTHQDLTDLQEGARIGVLEGKEDPKDFAIWKKTTEGITYPSPWSQGRPGWHTECAVMNHEVFNQMIDIHGGGTDLKFPHHENENAQTVATCGHGVSKYWMHVGFINLSKSKMSKSLGNIINVSDLEEKYNLLAFKFLILAHHYQQPINYSDDLMDQYEEEYKKIERALRKAFLMLSLNNSSFDEDIIDKKYLIKFKEEMDNNLNTPNAVSIIHELVKDLNKEKDLKNILKLYNTLKMILTIFGLEIEFAPISKKDIKLYKDWQKARELKDWEKADKYRAILQKKQLI